MKEIKNNKDFQEIFNNGQALLLDFYADWCGPCQTQLPIVEKLAEKHKEDITVAKINVDKNGPLANFFKVKSIPSLFFIDKGIVVERLTGLQTESTLEAKIQVHTGLAA